MRLKKHFLHDVLRQNPFRSFICLLIFACVWIYPHQAVHALEAPSDHIEIQGKPWRLYSHGIRTYALIDVYQCALYREETADFSLTPDSLEQPLAMTITIMTSELPDQVPDPWREAIKPEVSDKIYKRFKNKFARLKENDQLAFTYTPNESTDFFLNGKKVFTDKGSELIKALLDQWLGKDPISEDLKLALTKSK